jgi:hypothetical protein
VQPIKLEEAYKGQLVTVLDIRGFDASVALGNADPNDITQVIRNVPIVDPTEHIRMRRLCGVPLVIECLELPYIACSYFCSKRPPPGHWNIHVDTRVAILCEIEKDYAEAVRGTDRTLLNRIRYFFGA